MSARIPTGALRDVVLPALILLGAAQAALPIHAEASGDDGEWTQIVPSSPPPGRYDHSAIYDPPRHRMIVFGGFDSNSGQVGDVWQLALWGSDQWSLISPAGTPPSSRDRHRAIYDPVRDRMIVIGGRLIPQSGFEIWSLSLSGTPEWSPIIPLGTGPPELEDHTAIYDPVRDRIVVFGGRMNTSPFYPTQVWELTLSDPPTWTLLTPSGTWPSGRESHTAIYDPVRDRMLVFGGWDGAAYRSDVWALTLSGTPTWSQLTPIGTPPPARWEHAAVYDPVRDRMVMFGGRNAQVQNDAWRLTLSGNMGWSMLLPSGNLPAKTYKHSVIYDRVRDQMVAFGGIDVTMSHDLWSLDWDQDITGVGPQTPSVRLLLHPVRPNPSRASAEFRYEIARDEPVTIEVLDLQGRVARRVRQGIEPAGRHAVALDRRDAAGVPLAAGMYVVRVKTRDESRTTRWVVLP